MSICGGVGVGGLECVFVLEYVSLRVGSNHSIYPPVASVAAARRVTSRIASSAAGQLDSQCIRESWGPRQKGQGPSVNPRASIPLIAVASGQVSQAAISELVALDLPRADLTASWRSGGGNVFQTAAVAFISMMPAAPSRRIRVARDRWWAGRDNSRFKVRCALVA